jgi:predicted nuclease with TOPRIM domain
MSDMEFNPFAELVTQHEEKISELEDSLETLQISYEELLDNYNTIESENSRLVDALEQIEVTISRVK